MPCGTRASWSSYRAGVYRLADAELSPYLDPVAVSPYRDRSVLKGGLLLKVLGVYRPTRDADVLARKVVGDEESLLAVVKEVSSIAMDDGMTFNASRARAMPIRGHAVCPVFTRNQRQVA